MGESPQATRSPEGLLTLDPDVLQFTHFENGTVNDRYGKIHVGDTLCFASLTFGEKRDATLVYEATCLALTGYQLGINQERENIHGLTEVIVRDICRQFGLGELVYKGPLRFLTCCGMM